MKRQRDDIDDDESMTSRHNKIFSADDVHERSLEPGLTAPFLEREPALTASFLVHCPGQGDYNLRLMLWDDHRVQTSQDGASFEKHGEWNFPDTDLLEVRWHWSGEETKAIHPQTFQKIENTDCWKKINCSAKWSTFLLPWTAETPAP